MHMLHPSRPVTTETTAQLGVGWQRLQTVPVRLELDEYDPYAVNMHFFQQREVVWSVGRSMLYRAVQLQEGQETGGLDIRYRKVPRTESPTGNSEVMMALHAPDGDIDVYLKTNILHDFVRRSFKAFSQEDEERFTSLVVDQMIHEVLS